MNNQTRKQQKETPLRPMSRQELDRKLERSEGDIQAGKVYSQSEVEARLKDRRNKA
jgi:hypothetical protein